MADARKTAQQLAELPDLQADDIIPAARGSAALATVTAADARTFFSALSADLNLSNVDAAAGLASLGAADDALSNVDAAVGRAALLAADTNLSNVDPATGLAALGAVDTDLSQVNPVPARAALGVPSSAALAAASGGTLVSTVRSETGAVVRNIRDVLRDRVSVKDFGAIGDGTSRSLSSVTSFGGTDTTGWSLLQWQDVFPFATNTATNTLDYCAVQAAVNTGKLVQAPAGEYMMGANTVAVRGVAGNDGATIQGDNWGATYFVFSGTSGDCFNFEGVTGAGIYDCTIDCTQVRTSGAAIHFANSNDLSSSGVRFKALSGGKFFRCYAAEGAIGGGAQFLYKFDDYQIGDCVTGIAVGTTSTLVQDTWIGRGVIVNTDEEAVLLLNCSGVFIHGWPDFIACKHALKTFPGAGQTVTAVLSSGFLADTSDLHGVMITTNGGYVSNMNMTLWSASNGTVDTPVDRSLCCGVLIDQASGLIDGVRLAGEFFNNVTNGIAVTAAKNVTIDGAMIGYNSVFNVGTYAGVYVGPDAENVTISGGKSGKYGKFAIEPVTKAATQSYGIQIATGALNTVVTGVNVQENVTGGIINQGTGSVFGAIRGYRTRAEFVTAIESGNDEVSVTIPIDPVLNVDRVTVNDASNFNITCTGVTGQLATFTAIGGVVPSTVFFNVSVDQSEDFGITYSN